MQTVLPGYLLAINVVAFILYGADKQRAKQGAWRIPERVLLGVAALGGSVGALGGMYTFRHKTRHPKFTLGVPLLLAAQLAALWLLNP
ncbi:MAG: DUF1294 domain-containing protein [Gemmiger sp.]|nr:DUF1294 domain-containing protein [Gemmiger sp.]